MPNEKISTSALLRILFKAAKVEPVVKEHMKHMTPVPFHRYLSESCGERDTTPVQVIKKSGIEHAYGYQLFSGRRNPSRDKVIQLAFGFEMDYLETQALLKKARKSPLYARIARDAVIIHALERKRDIAAVQATLFDLALPILGKEDRYE